MGRECTTLFIRPSRTCFSAVTVAFRPDLPIASGDTGPGGSGASSGLLCRRLSPLRRLSEAQRKGPTTPFRSLYVLCAVQYIGRSRRLSTAQIRCGFRERTPLSAGWMAREEGGWEEGTVREGAARRSRAAPGSAGQRHTMSLRLIPPTTPLPAASLDMTAPATLHYDEVRPNSRRWRDT